MRVCSTLFVFALAGCAALPPSGQDVQARAAIERLFDDFNACRIEALVANYADEDLVFFTPGTTRPLTSRAELAQYFSYLEAEPCASPASAKHTSLATQSRSIGPSAAVVHATTVVKYEDDGKAVSFPFYFAFVLEQRKGRWLVVSQSAQPVPRK